MNLKFRCIDSAKGTAQENMQIDASLLKNYDNTPTFRLYTWEKNSFSIGRFQSIEDIDSPSRYGNSWAQRETGGGVLLHGFDLSYSMVLPSKSLKSKSVKESYEYLCSFLLTFYKELGLHVRYAKDILSDKLSKSIFCQEGFEAYDMVVKGTKIGGNAQRRTKELILQHGSIPLFRDSREYAGSSLEALGITLDENDARELLKKSFLRTFQAEFENR